MGDWVKAAASWEDYVQGEWWLTRYGSEFADSSVGDSGHEQIAEQSLLSMYEDEIREGLEAKGLKSDWNESDELHSMYHEGDIPIEVLEAAMGPELYKLFRDDVRLAYSRKTGAVMAINLNFWADKVGPHQIEWIQDHLYEEASGAGTDLKGDPDILIEEGSTQRHVSMPLSDFLQVKNPGELWRFQGAVATVMAASEKIPDLLYHGSPTAGLTDLFYDPEFARMDVNELVEGAGVYLTESYRVARSYAGSEGSVYEVKLKAASVLRADQEQNYLDLLERAGKQFQVDLSGIDFHHPIDRCVEGRGSVTNFGEAVRMILLNEESFVMDTANEDKAEQIRDFINQDISEWPVVRYLDPNIDDGRTHVYVVRQDQPGQHVRIVREIPVGSPEDEEMLDTDTVQSTAESFLPARLIELDCEMTGVVPTRDKLLQVAMLKLELDGHQYREVGEPLVLYLQHDGQPQNDFHRKYLSHIFEKCNQSTLQAPEAKQQIHQWLGDWKGTVTPTGDCVMTDLNFLTSAGCIDTGDIGDQGQIPGTFHFESFDANPIKALARHKAGRKEDKKELAGFDEEGIHDALVDCHNQLKELNHYLGILLGPAGHEKQPLSEAESTATAATKEEIKEQFAKTTSFLHYPVTVAGDPDHHITIKFFGKTPVTIEQIQQALEGIDLDVPEWDEWDWTPVEFDSKQNGKVRVLELTDFPERLKLQHDALEPLRADDYPTYRPHITVSDELWEQVRDEKLSPVDLEVQIDPLVFESKGERLATLSSGDVALRGLGPKPI